MKAIHISASREYEVLIGPGLIAGAGRYIREASGARLAAVISDDSVFPLYGERLQGSLGAAGFDTLRFVFPHGESSKTLGTYGELMSFLARSRVSRSDLLVALGGGVVGDVTGFAAGTYQRGTPYVQIPTTLLAAVDSSVGGKTAVDLPEGKNLAGCFWQPSLVLCDTDSLHTLPEEERRDGCAEVIKYAVLGSPALFDRLRGDPQRPLLEATIAECVAMKAAFVAEDEFDRGRRRLLNLGHSFGHAIEAAAGYTLSHGAAVAVGMCMAARSAAAKGFCSGETRDKILELIALYGLPTETDETAERLLELMLSDKKMSGGLLHLIVPEAIGRCRVEPVPPEALKSWLLAGGAR